MSSNRKYLNLFLSQKNICLNDCKMLEDFTPKSKHVQDQERKIIKFSAESQKEELEKLQWRNKTEFPIVKILNYRKLNKTVPSTRQFLSKKVLVQLSLQTIFYNLSEVDQIPIFKVFYLLKQTLIGVERLCNVYGNFLLKSNMIVIDSKKKCKVWHNSRLHLNKPEFRSQNEEETVRSVIEVFSLKTKISLKSTKFYRDLQFCTTFCDCLLILKNYTFQNRIPSTFMLVDKFSSNMCSPRKYISRPPSNECNPESPSKALQRLKSPNPETHKITQSETWKFTMFMGNRQKVNSFAGLKNSQSPDFTFRRKLGISPRKTQRDDFQNYLTKLVQKIQESESISPKSVNKLTMFPLEAKRTLGVIESVFEGDSSCPSINDTSDQPRIRLLEPVLKEDKSDSFNETVLYRSSISLGRSHNDLCLNMMGSRFFQNNDEVITPIRGANIHQAFQPFVKLIDESFDEGHQCRS